MAALIEKDYNEWHTEDYTVQCGEINIFRLLSDVPAAIRAVQRHVNILKCSGKGWQNHGPLTVGQVWAKLCHVSNQGNADTKRSSSAAWGRLLVNHAGQLVKACKHTSWPTIDQGTDLYQETTFLAKHRPSLAQYFPVACITYSSSPLSGHFHYVSFCFYSCSISLKSHLLANSIESM